MSRMISDTWGRAYYVFRYRPAIPKARYSDKNRVRVKVRVRVRVRVRVWIVWSMDAHTAARLGIADLRNSGPSE